MKRRFSSQRLHQWFVSAVYPTFFLSPLFEFEKSVQLRDLSVRTRLWCHNAISRIFTSTNLGRTDDLDRRTCIFGRISRAGSCQCAGDDELAFACTSG